MAYAPKRSCNYDLECGMTDGKYRRYAPNRGGTVEATSAPLRQEMSGLWHGFREAQIKVLSDGSLHRSREYHNIDPDDMENV